MLSFLAVPQDDRRRGYLSYSALPLRAYYQSSLKEGFHTEHGMGVSYASIAVPFLPHMEVHSTLYSPSFCKGISTLLLCPGIRLNFTVLNEV